MTDLMESIMTITTPAADRSLLTLAELREATGIADGSRDAALTTLGARVASTLAAACRIRSSGVTPATFRLEAVSEVFREVWSEKQLFLSRFPVVSVAAVSEDAESVTTADYELMHGAGVLRRLSADRPVCWRGAKITVVYTAGWAVVPDDLKLAAVKTANLLWLESGPSPRDPNLRRERVEGVGEAEYWVPPASDPLLSGEIRELLARFMNFQMV